MVMSWQIFWFGSAGGRAFELGVGSAPEAEAIIQATDPIISERLRNFASLSR